MKESWPPYRCPAPVTFTGTCTPRSSTWVSEAIACRPAAVCWPRCSSMWRKIPHTPEVHRLLLLPARCSKTRPARPQPRCAGESQPEVSLGRRWQTFASLLNVTYCWEQLQRLVNLGQRQCQLRQSFGSGRKRRNTQLILEL